MAEVRRLNEKNSEMVTEFIRIDLERLDRMLAGVYP